MRLTKETPFGNYYAIQNYVEQGRDEEECIHKLGILEDIEEELGIDLIILFKALKNGIWTKTQGKNTPLLFFYKNVSLYKDYLYACPIDIYDERVCIHEYGKTWALTKEELL